MHLMKSLKYFLLANMFILLNGCAMTTDSVRVNYQLNPPDPNAYYSKQHTAIYVNKIADNRDVNNPNLIIHKENLYGDTTSGGYAADKPVAIIIQQALAVGLKQIGYEQTSAARYVLQGSIEDINLKTVVGIFKGTLGIEIRLNLQLINSANSKLLWQQDITGHGKVVTATFSGAVVKQAFQNALTNIIHQLQGSSIFYHALNQG